MTLRSLPKPLRERAAGVWAFRARAEAQASARFVQLHHDLRAANAPAIVLEMAEEAASEEAEHVRLCVELVHALGAKIDAPSIPTLQTNSQPTEKEARILLQVVGMCCINETISAAVLAEMLRQSAKGQVHNSIQQILSDEIGHSRMGWAYLSFMSEHGYAPVVAQGLPSLLANAVTDELFETPEVDDPNGPIQTLGALPRESRFKLFSVSLTELVFPGLERFGVDTQSGKQWLAGRTKPVLDSAHAPIHPSDDSASGL